MTSTSSHSLSCLFLTLTLAGGLVWNADREPLATLDGEPITYQEYADYLLETVGKRPLIGLINRKLIAREASRLDLTIDESELARSFELSQQALLSRWQGDAEKVAEELQRQGFTLESYRRRVKNAKRHELLSDLICRTTREVTNSDIYARFEQLYGPGGKRLEVQHIYLDASQVAHDLRIAGDPSPSDEKVRAKMREQIESLLAELEGGADFGLLARKHSDDYSSSLSGGKLALPRLETYGTALVTAAKSAVIGSPTGPIATAEGAHLIEVTARATTRLEDVREALRAKLVSAPASPAELADLEKRLSDAAVIEGL